MPKPGPRYQEQLVKQREWKAQNRERVREYNARYRAEHADDIAAQVRAYRAANADRVRAYNVTYLAQWRARNLERKRAMDRDYYRRNRTARTAWQAEYVRTHPRNLEKARAAQRNRLARRPGLNAHYLAARRAREIGAPGSHTLTEWRAKVAEYGGKCAYCHEGRPLARDHVVPLSRGGSDYIANIVPACKPCNSRKGTRLVT